MIGFETGSIEATEYPPNEREAELVLFTPVHVLLATILRSTLNVTVGVNDTLSTATLGNPMHQHKPKTIPVLVQYTISFVHSS